MARRSIRSTHPGAVIRAERGAHGYTGGVSADSLSDPAGTSAPVLGQAANVTAIGTTTSTTALSAIAGSYADLAAARTSVNTLRGEVETARGVIESRLDTVEGKIDAIISALRASGLMA